MRERGKKKKIKIKIAGPPKETIGPFVLKPTCLQN
jgi:hypothetical protein